MLQAIDRPVSGSVLGPEIVRPEMLSRLRRAASSAIVQAGRNTNLARRRAGYALYVERRRRGAIGIS